MNRIWKVRSPGVDVKRVMHERIVVPTELHGAETWGLSAREKKRNKEANQESWCVE